ncbi:MAG: ABC transporter ATP-binding protein [Verrucomicrobiae bacterium]|nr:ABC transporter ATP-binding protein [Verrucomicrobiae bacterium]
MAVGKSKALEEVKQNKITGKDIAKMSTKEFVENAKGPYLRILGYLKPHKTRFAMGVVFGILSGMFNGILLLGIRTVFTVVLPTADEVSKPIKPFHGMPFWHDFEIQRPDVPQDQQIWFVIAICMCVPLLILARGLLTYLHQYCMLWVGNRVLYRLRDECFSGLLRQSQTFFNSAKQGELMQTVFNQTRMAASAGTDLASAFIKHPVSIISIMVVLLHMDPIYTLGALVVFPLCILPVLQISRKVRKAGGREEEEAGAIMVTMQESFAGIRVVKAHAREEYERERFNKGSRKMLEYIMRWSKALEIVGPLVETVASLGIAVGLVYAWHEQVDAKKFLVLNMALMSIYPHAKALSRVQIQLQKCLMATSKVFAYMDADPEVADKPDAIDLKDARGELEFDNITFSYIEGIPALQNVSLKIEDGKTYALVGQSGAGKSTIMSLLMRFYDPDEGVIRFDGHDIRDLTQRSLRDQIGLVSQETFLFHDTIYNNIRYGKLDATKAEIEEAAKLAHAHEFIVEQSFGYDTMLGDKGCTLSGGQQQRISIARAILRNAPVLLLDEATSALDSESEKKIQEALEMLAKGKTVVAIAHRLSTILNSDKIVVMKHGRVLDVGPHAELLERCEEYQQLYQLQFHGHETPEDATVAV